MKRRENGSILVIVMITLIFTATALVMFLEKANNELAVDAHVIIADRLRKDAYSAVEVTLATLVDFGTVDSGLHSPSEGWGDPLGWAGWTPDPGHTVEVSFQDESGKIPLIHADSAVLNTLFQSWDMTANDSQHLTDVILGWMQQNYIPTSTFNPDYEQADVPYDPPLRAIRTFNELSAIDYAKDVFYDKLGRPNDLWWRFANDFSLFNYRNPDINGANTDVLGAVGQFAGDQQQKVTDYLSGVGDYSTLGQQYFQNTAALRGVVGGTGNAAAFGTSITALRILVTVHEGPHSQFRLSVVVAPQGGARTVETTATDMKAGASTSATGETSAAAAPAGQSTAPPINQSNEIPTSAQTSAAAAGTAALQYPFTILEVLENDQIPTQPPPPPVPAK